MVEHSTADREVPGSNPGAPSFFFFFFFFNSHYALSNSSDCSLIYIFFSFLFFFSFNNSYYVYSHCESCALFLMEKKKK